MKDKNGEKAGLHSEGFRLRGDREPMRGKGSGRRIRGSKRFRPCCRCDEVSSRPAGGARQRLLESVFCGTEMAKPAVSVSGDSMGRAWPCLKVLTDPEGS